MQDDVLTELVLTDLLDVLTELLEFRRAWPEADPIDHVALMRSLLATPANLRPTTAKK